MLTSYREGQLDDIKQRMYTYLTLVRNWFLLFLLLFVAALVYWFMYPKNIMGAAFSLISFLPLLALGVQYVRENNIYRKEASAILNQDLDLEKYAQILDYETLVTVKFQTNWDRIIIRKAELAWLQGNFEETNKFLEMVNPLKVRVSPKERTPLLLTYYLVEFATGLFEGKEVDLQNYLSRVEELVVQNDAEATQKTYTQQILSLMNSVLKDKEAVSDFDDIPVNYKLEEVLRDYLLAENARLAEDKDIAKKLFKKVSQEEKSLYLVKQAKAAVKQMK
ncbi:hypothetical protein ACVR1G_08740 [Streptococcus dentasini]